MRREKEFFTGDYVRGGRSTLYMTRSDVVETLEMIRRKYPGQLKALLSESKRLLEENRESEKGGQ